MSEATKAFAILAVLLYNLALVAGFAYLVAAHGWSGWWFLGVMMLLAEMKFPSGKGDSAAL